MKPSVLIAGAGIGGLTAALKLHRLGVKVSLIDAARELQPLGVGINLLPHGAGVLYGLGLGDELKATGIQTRAIEYRTQYGQLIQRDPRGLHAGSPWPQYSIHRGQLQMLLHRAVQREIGPVRTDHRMDRFEHEGSGVRVHMRQGSSGEVTSERFDALIGADGIHSATCAQLHPDASPLAFSGTMMWRGAVEREPFLDTETMVICGHHDSKAVIYPISREAAQRGRSLINWVAEINIGRDAKYQREDWNRAATVEEFLPAFADWHFDFLDVPALFRATERIFVYPMADREALPFWSQGGVSLLGDAAHPMYPIGANGASQAILDADALGTAFSEADLDVHAALKLYESRRLPATAKVVASNRTLGPEAVLQLARERITGPNDVVSDLITPEEIAAITQGYQKVAGFDAATLSARAQTMQSAG